MLNGTFWIDVITPEFRILIENNRGNMIEYAKNHRLLHLLEPEFGIVGDSGKTYNKLGRKYGVNIDGDRKIQGLQYLNDWLFRKRGMDTKGNYSYNLHHIFDINLIKELVILHPNDNELDKIIRKLILEKK